MIQHKYVSCKWCGRKTSAVSVGKGRDYKVECNICHDAYYLCPDEEHDDNAKEVKQ